MSECHKIATEYQINLPRTCGNVLEMSSDAAKKTMESNRICFIKVIESLQYLARKEWPCRVTQMMNQTLFSC